MFCGDTSRCTMFSSWPSGVAAAVRVVERRGHLGRDVDGQRDRQRHAQLAAGLLDRAQVAAVDVLHRDEVAAGLDLAEVVDVDDVRVVQLRRELGLVDEHRDELFVVGQVRQDLLDRDDLLEALDARALGLVELGHAAGGDPLEDLVLAEPVRARRRRPRPPAPRAGAAAAASRRRRGVAGGGVAPAGGLGLAAARCPTACPRGSCPRRCRRRASGAAAGAAARRQRGRRLVGGRRRRARCGLRGHAGPRACRAAACPCRSRAPALSDGAGRGAAARRRGRRTRGSGRGRRRSRGLRPRPRRSDRRARPRRCPRRSAATSRRRPGPCRCASSWRRCRSSRAPRGPTPGSPRRRRAAARMSNAPTFWASAFRLDPV